MTIGLVPRKKTLESRKKITITHLNLQGNKQTFSALNKITHSKWLAWGAVIFSIFFLLIVAWFWLGSEHSQVGLASRWDTLQNAVSAARDTALGTDAASNTDTTKAETGRQAVVKPKLNESLFKPESPKSNYFLQNNPTSQNNAPLDKFFEALQSVADTDHIHLAFYGDSQIEGDRVTSNMRPLLGESMNCQNALGFVPIIERSTNMSVNKNLGGKWQKYSFFDKKHPSKRYGASGMAFKFYAPSATLKLNFRNMKHRGYLLSYGKTNKPLIINVYNAENWKRIVSDTLEADSLSHTHFHVVYWPEAVSKVKFEFLSKSSVDVFGLYLYESRKGLQIDNYGLLGHSGNGFLFANASFMASQHKALNTRLVLLQFGANAIPYINSPKEYQYMRKEFSKMIQKVKEICPEASILLVSPGEMARRINGRYIAYGNARHFRDMLKDLAITHEVAFFDTYALMGSQPNLGAWLKKKWVYSDGHLTEKGHYAFAKAISEALIAEWAAFKAR